MDIQQAKVSRYNSSIQNIQISEEEIMDVRRGPWTVEEDFTLINYIAHHGEGRWNSLARCAGLNRTGKSCRLRWLNYLRPDVRRGNITLEEQLLILELHSRWGNRWSKIAQHLPGRTDNEIKNYWRTRVQKHAKQLKCDVNSKQFKDTMRYLWMPRLLERIQASATTPPAAPASSSTTTDSSVNYQNNIKNLDMGSAQMTAPAPQPPPSISSVRLHRYTSDQTSSGAAASSDSFGTDHQVSPVSDLTDCYNYPVNEGNNNHQDYYYSYNYNNPAAANQSGYGDHDQSLTTPNGYFNPGSGSGLDKDFQVMDQNNQWMAMDGGDVSDNLWNDDDMWFLHHQY